MGSEIQTEATLLEESEDNSILEAGGERDEYGIESHEESVREALKELSQQESDGSSGEGESEELEPQPAEKGLGQAKSSKGQASENSTVEFEEIDPELLPPERLKAHEKTWFEKIPQKGLKKAIHRTIKELEGTTTRANQEAARVTKEASSVLEAVKPYHDQFTERGMTTAQGIAALCLAQKRLTDPSTKDDVYVSLGVDIKPTKQAWLRLGNKLGYSSGSSDADRAEAPEISNHPDIVALKNENRRLREMVEPEYNARKQATERSFQEQYSSTLSELESVQNEIDVNGNYKYPELLTSASFLESWKPLVSALVRNERLSYRDAAVEAYRRMKGFSSSQRNQAKLPASNNNKAISAAVSVRGRSSSTGYMPRESPDVSPGETPEQSARAALAELMRG